MEHIEHYGGSFFAFAMDTFGTLQLAQEKYKERIMRDWEESKNLPRKKKKQKRKELQLEWTIANYDPFTI